MKPQELGVGPQRGVEGARVVVGIDDPAFIGQAAGGRYLKVVIIPHRHVEGDTLAPAVGLRHGYVDAD